MKRIGRHTIALDTAPAVLGFASVVGSKEGQGPLRESFDYISEDATFGESSWEKAESHMLRQCFELSCAKAQLSPSQLDMIFAGDLLNQCVSSSFAMKDSQVPYLGLYGACSTMAEGLLLASLMLEGGFASRVCALTGSHFCSAERQYRFPLEYGGQRCPTAQWTVTGAGSVVLGGTGGGVHVTQVTPGVIVDAGIKDANAMGSAMAPAALDTLKTHFADTQRRCEDYDAIFTGDLGALGHDLLETLLDEAGYPVDARYRDCGVLLYDRENQDVHAGGSGCGCSASVLCAHILPGMLAGRWHRVLFAATGALMSPVTTQQGGSIPGICHAVVLEA